MEPQLTKVFKENYRAYKSGSHLIINQGGQGSSKTYSILQFLYYLARFYGPKRISIVSYALPHLKAGAMADFEKILISFGENVSLIKNKTESIYYISKSIIEFFGIEGNIAKSHGPRRDILFINECNRKITYDVFDQLSTRTQRCTFLDFNPDQAFWLHDKVIPNFPHILIKSNYMANPWLPERELNNILMKKDKPGYEMWWKVYGLGELGTLEGAILANWKYGDFDTSLPFGYGLDFGFNDPDAMVKVAINKNRKIIYCDEKIYISGNSADQLRQLVGSHVKRNDLIIADAADARMIAELRRYFNIKPVNKAKWTVPEALKLMQDYEIIITDTSHNLANELNNYIWSDKKAGVPVAAYDHLIDCVRYYFQTFLNIGTGATQIWHM